MCASQDMRKMKPLITLLITWSITILSWKNPGNYGKLVFSISAHNAPLNTFQNLSWGLWLCLWNSRRGRFAFGIPLAFEVGAFTTTTAFLDPMKVWVWLAMVCEESGGIYLFNQKQLFLYGENNDKVKQSAPTKGAQRAHNSLMLDYETSKWTLFPAFSYYHYSSLFLHFKKIR